MALVLIVVDQPDTLLTLQSELETAGHHTVLAADADTALDRLAHFRVDVVVLDVTMPVGDGWSLLQELRDQPDPPPVIVLSGAAEAPQVERARRLGAVGAVAGNAPAEDLIRAVAHALAEWPRGRATTHEAFGTAN